MQTFQVRFSRNPLTVLMLLIVPLLGAAIFITPLILFPQTPDWLVILTIVVMMCVSISALLYINKKWVSIMAEVAMDEHGIDIRLLRRSLLYRRREYTSNWEGLENVSTSFDPQHNRRLYTIRFRNPSATVTLIPEDFAEAEFETPFGEALLRNVDRYNSTHTAMPDKHIHNRGFFDTLWAKGLTVFCYILIIVALTMRLTDPERVSNTKLMQLLVVSMIWLGTYYVNRRGTRSLRK